MGSGGSGMRGRIYTILISFNSAQCQIVRKCIVAQFQQKQHFPDSDRKITPKKANDLKEKKKKKKKKT